MGGEKMSKSLGNVLAIPAVLQRVRPAELRYYLGSAHYRSMLEFSETALQDAAKAYTGIEEFLHRVRSRVGDVEPGEWTAAFAAALDDDLAVPIALAEVHAARAEGNRALEAGDHETAMARARSIRAMMDILGADSLDERWESATRRRPRWPPWMCRFTRKSSAGKRPGERKTGRRPTRSGPAEEGGRGRHRHLRRAAVDAARTGTALDTWNDPMAGNSQRRGAVRKAGTKKGPKVGSGGVRRRGLEGRGATPPAHMRPDHPAAKRAASRRSSSAVSRNAPTTPRWCWAETRWWNVCGGRAGHGAVRRSRYRVRRTADGIRHARSRCRYRYPGGTADDLDPDKHATECIRASRCRCLRTSTRIPTTCLRSATSDTMPALLVALDNISDPRNLGAIVRSVAAFGGHGVVIPQRRSASVTAVAWRPARAPPRGCGWPGRRISIGR